MKYILLSILLFSSVLEGFSQITQDNAPLSRFGLGDMIKSDFPALLSQGGEMPGYISNSQLNFSNPASFAFLRMTSFDVAVNATFKNMSDQDESILVRNGYLNHLAIGFPLRNPLREQVELETKPYHFGMGLGLLPYSRMNYNLESIVNDPNFGQVQYNFSGQGGIYQLISGIGFRYNRTAIGLSSQYHFGKLTYDRRARLNELEFAMEDRLRDDTRVSGFTFKLGLLHDIRISEAVQNRSARGISFGASMELPGSIGTSNTTLVTRFSNAYGTDTILSKFNEPGTLKMPFSINAGVTFYQIEKLSFSINTKLTNWSNSEHDYRPLDLLNTYYVSAGASYTPDFRDFNTYSNRITYRGGMFYGTDPRQVGMEQMQEFGISFGLGLPLRVGQMMPLSYCQIAIEGGYRGISNVLEERFIRLHLGFTLTDNTWFYKQKFN